ncbi:MAG: dihydrofolate reductase [Limosilactobacillus pontis]|uniref:Dihydrofolate reductase n=1 Tax=Limosilactobacillus pontis TaxID=35787 RepID=A0A2J6NMR1_9LACO|nr:dihydrofolate reductase [Limosilactobacillus pontis]PMB82506.1 dihydrofolate reductase [Limosilactobacillus pontis]
MTAISFVWAEDLDGWIGKNNALPWHVPADMRHFKRVTMGHPVIMGRRTYESIGRPLPHRENIVLTRQNLAIPGVTVVHDLPALKELLDQLPIGENACVIGGARVFAALLPLATVLEKTVINGHYDGDTKMPPVDYSRWHLVDRQTVSDDGPVPVCWFEQWRLNEK